MLCPFHRNRRAAWAELPAIDSKDLWPVLSGANKTSPREPSQMLTVTNHPLATAP